MIPRGAVVVDASKKVIFNAYFTGLSFQTACESRAYMHFRRPESLQAQALLRKPGIVKSSDFLDCINKDTPTGQLESNISILLIFCDRNVEYCPRYIGNYCICQKSLLGWLHILFGLAD